MGLPYSHELNELKRIQRIMGKDNYCQIRLDPFYQAFLRARFDQLNSNNGMFEFDKGHDLSLMFQFLLRPKPPGYKQPLYGAEAFKIRIPAMEHKNPQTYCYLSDDRQQLLIKRIMRYWKMVSHDIIAEGRRRGIQKKDLVYMLLDEMDLPEYYSDRIEREYSRFLHEERNRKYLKHKRETVKRLECGIKKKMGEAV